MDQEKWLAMGVALITIAMQVGSQLLLRSQTLELGALPAHQILLRALLNPIVWIAIGALVLGMIAWIFTISKLELNQAYPLVALTIPLTAVLATWLFGEPLPWLRGAGISLIVVGVLVVASS